MFIKVIRDIIIIVLMSYGFISLMMSCQGESDIKMIYTGVER